MKAMLIIRSIYQLHHCAVLRELHTLSLPIPPHLVRSKVNEIAPNSGIHPVCALNPSTRFVSPGAILRIRLNPIRS